MVAMLTVERVPQMRHYYIPQRYAHLSLIIVSFFKLPQQTRFDSSTIVLQTPIKQ